MRRLVVATLLFCCAISLAAGCGSAVGTDGETFLFTDDYGRDVEVPKHPLRVVSLSPAVTELLYALHADSLLVGRTDYCTFPPEAQAIASIGGISNLNIERLVSLRPDVVISGSMVPQRAVERLDKMGVPVVCVIEKPHFDALYNNIHAIAQLVGCYEAAALLCDSLRDEMKTFVDTVPTICQPTLYYVVGYGAGGNYTAGGNSFISDIISYSGCRNIAANIEGWSYSLERLLAQDPDYVLIRREDSASFCSMHPYNMLSAVRSHRVIAIESGWIDLQSPRNILAIKHIRSAVKPNASATSTSQPRMPKSR